MADISKITIESGTYDIKDTVSRETLDIMNSNDTIFLGDSYAAGTTYESGSVQFLTSWCEKLRQIMGLTSGHYYIYAQGNAGFARVGNNSMNFQMTLQSHLDDIQNKNMIKNIIVCAGYNDHHEDYALIDQRIGEFVAFCKTNFPNAQVYIGMIGGDSRDSETGREIRYKLLSKVLNAYNKCDQYGAIYLSGVENFSHNFYQFNNQGNHPNEAGYIYVAAMIYNAWKNGSTSLYEPLTTAELPTNFSNNLYINGIMCNDTKMININNYTASNVDLTDVNTQIEIVSANTTNKVIKATIQGKTDIPVDLFVQSGEDKYYANGKLLINDDGSVVLISTLFAFVHTVTTFVIWGTSKTFPMLTA